MMGHLLYLLNEVDKKTMAKFERESQKMGKSSFAFAWALDETEEERSRFKLLSFFFFFSFLFFHLKNKNIHFNNIIITEGLQWIFQFENLKQIQNKLQS